MRSYVSSYPQRQKTHALVFVLELKSLFRLKTPTFKLESLF